jgi:hypothetical protein
VTRADESIPLRPVGAPPVETTYRPFLIASLSLAVLLGFLLGIHVSVTRLLDAGSPERTADLVHAHGQVQLLGFAGLFVMGMSLRLMPRFAGSRIAFEPLIPLTLGLIVAGLVLRSAIQPWFSGDLHDALFLASAFFILCGSACFLFITFGTLAVDARRFDASSLAFVIGATLLFGASLVTVFAAIDAVEAGASGLPYLVNTAVLQLQLAGFLFAFILGVALRAIPAMVGVTRPGRSAGFLALALGASVVVFAGSLIYLEYVEFSDVAVVIASAAFLALGFVFLGLIWQAGVGRQAANRIRPASQQNLWLIRSAFLWLLFAALASIYIGATSALAVELPDQFQFDLVRHSLGVGVVTMLIVGMSMMILPQFAAGRLRANQQARLAIALVIMLNAAAVLRVIPSIAATSWTADQRNLSIALAGSLAELALLIFAVYLLRLLLKTRGT